MRNTESDFPKFAEAIFGRNPGDILDETVGKPSHFYYIVSHLLWVSLVPVFGLSIGSGFEKGLELFIIEYISHEPGDTVRYGLALIFLPLLLSIVCLRPILYPMNDKGTANWRWRKNSNPQEGSAR